VGEFYEGKRREQALRRNSYLQAVHETGARLTHDVKNLLQSLYALTSLAPRRDDEAFAALMQRQLPQLTKRLHATLEKLRSPEVAAVDLPVSARAWWAETQRRLAGSDVAMEATIGEDRDIPGALFDGFLENTLENARAKAAREPGIEIRVVFACDGREAQARVCDSGSRVPEAVAERLFREPLERGSGLGIGLFNAARMARQGGCRLTLADNRDGHVCFALAIEPESARDG